MIGCIIVDMLTSGVVNIVWQTQVLLCHTSFNELCDLINYFTYYVLLITINNSLKHMKYMHLTTTINNIPDSMTVSNILDSMSVCSSRYAGQYDSIQYIGQYVSMQ